MTKGKIIFLSKSFIETKILPKLDPSCISPCTGIKAIVGKINDNPTSINIPPPRLSAVDIKHVKKLKKIKNIALLVEIVWGNKIENSILFS